MMTSFDTKYKMISILSSTAYLFTYPYPNFTLHLQCKNNVLVKL